MYTYYVLRYYEKQSMQSLAYTCTLGKKWLSLALAYLSARYKRLQLQWSRSELLLLPPPWHKLALLPRAQTSVCCLTEGALASWPLTCVGCFPQLLLQHQEAAAVELERKPCCVVVCTIHLGSEASSYYTRMELLLLQMALSQRTLRLLL